MKKQYDSPEWEFIRVLPSDIIMDSTISDGGMGEGGGQTGDPGDESGGGF